ncbi:MAG TPA: peptidase S9 family protein, partial [Idiomarina sp.]|nr:peptidase S9 family protein [Idiomarina sp.]
MWLKASAIAVSLGVVAPQVSADTFKSEDIFQLEYANQVSVSPDGNYVAYIRNSFDDMKDSTRRSLWVVDTRTGESLPIFDDGHSYSGLSWSNDSSRLAFTSNRNEKNQIHVYWLDEQKVAKVTNVHESPSSLSWSNDDQHIAFMMSVKAPATDFAKSVKMPARPEGANWADKAIIVEEAYYQRDGAGVLDPAHRQVFVVPATGGSARQLTEGEYSHRGPLSWTQDNQHIVFSGNRSENWAYQINESDLYAVALA